MDYIYFINFNKIIVIGKSRGVNSPNFPTLPVVPPASVPRHTCISNLINEAARPDFRIAHSPRDNGREKITEA